MNRTRRSATIALGLTLVIGLSGCGEQMTDDELFTQAREVAFTFRAALADVQMQLFDGEWKIYAYGAETWDCDGGGYRFEFQRSTLPQWKLNEPTRDAADRIATWLDENGWEDITTQGYSGDIADIVIQAEKSDAYVDRLMIDISPDPETYDIVSITAESTCQPGDIDVIRNLRNPGQLEANDRENAPLIEHPTAKPSFGYTPDGKRRFWDDTDGE